MNILLVEPPFPVSRKSKNHKHFFPIGLLKIGSYHKRLGDSVQLVRGDLPKKKVFFDPDIVMVSSLFTYWSGYVARTVRHYKRLFPGARVVVGGIFASLMPDECRRVTECDEVYVGLYKGGIAEMERIDFSLLPEDVDYQVIHASRGCPRRCPFCGVWKIEPRFTWKSSIRNEIVKPKLIFYDNNLLANPRIENILGEIIEFGFSKGTPYSRYQVKCESQSGLDGRILEEKPHLARLLKKARFHTPRIAWDGPVSEHKRIQNQVQVLLSAGYRAKDIFVFMLYNYTITYEELKQKLDFCWRWKVRVADCRFRPLDSLFDNYMPQVKVQTRGSYYIHPNWTDGEIRAFRREVRWQNIAIMFGLPKE